MVSNDTRIIGSFSDVLRCTYLLTRREGHELFGFHLTQPGKHCYPYLDPPNEQIQLQVFIWRMVSFVCICIRHGEIRDAEDFGEHIVWQAASHGWNQQWLLSCGSEDSLPERFHKGGIQRCFGGGHTPLADNIH